jgi:hypothetical protein
MIEGIEGTEATNAVIDSKRRLGKLPPKFDKRTLTLPGYIEKRRLPKVPKTHALSKKTLSAMGGRVGMMLNDVLGCCTIAALGHSHQAWSVYGGKPWRPTDDEIVEAYDRVNGGEDNGAYMLDVLNMARKEGIGGNRIFAYVSINPLNHDQVRTAHYLFGNLYFGANLPVSAQDQKVWDVVEGNGSEPGSWGGHAMNAWDLTPTGLVVPTWGAMQRMTWAWWDRYVDECYTILEEDYVGEDKRSPQGFSLAKLAKDLKAI